MISAINFSSLNQKMYKNCLSMGMECKLMDENGDVQTPVNDFKYSNGFSLRIH